MKLKERLLINCLERSAKKFSKLEVTPFGIISLICRHDYQLRSWTNYDSGVIHKLVRSLYNVEDKVIFTINLGKKNLTLRSFNLRSLYFKILLRSFSKEELGALAKQLTPSVTNLPIKNMSLGEEEKLLRDSYREFTLEELESGSLSRRR